MARQKLPTRRQSLLLDALLNGRRAVLASIAMQYGAPLETLARAMGRLGDKRTPASPLGAILDMAAQR